HQRQPGRERRVAADGPEQEVEDERQGEGHERAEDEQRTVAQPLPQVLRRQEERRAHQSLRALPVRCRNTDSRSGSDTSTRATPPPAAATRSTIAGSRRAAPVATTCSVPACTSTRRTPSRPSRAVAAGPSSPAASSLTT